MERVFPLSAEYLDVDLVTAPASTIADVGGRKKVGVGRNAGRF